MSLNSKDFFAWCFILERKGDNYVLYDRQTWGQEAEGELRVVFEDGKALNRQTTWEIRQRLHGAAFFG